MKSPTSIALLLASAGSFASASAFTSNQTVGSGSQANGTATCTELNQRKAWHTLSNDEKSDYLGAVKCLMDSPAKSGIEGAVTRWDELQACHSEQSNFIHGNGPFLPWHRLFVRLHEKLLQDECGYKGSLPYWDVQRDYEIYGAIEKASVWGDNDYSFGTNGASIGNGTDKCVMDGPFANTTLRMTQDYGVDSYDPYCLSREFNQTAWETANQTNVDECLAQDDYNATYLCFSNKPHSNAHLGTGGTMYNQNASPGDPVFYLHHANLDRHWWQWQKANLSARLTDMGGSVFPKESAMEVGHWLTPSSAYLDYDGDPGNQTTLNHVLWTMGIMPNHTIDEVMDLRGSLICADYVEDDYPN